MGSGARSPLVHPPTDPGAQHHPPLSSRQGCGSLAYGPAGAWPHPGCGGLRGGLELAALGPSPAVPGGHGARPAMQVRCKIGLGQLLPDLTSFTAVAKAFECLVQDAVGWFQGMVRAGSPPCGCCMLLASKARTLLMRPWLLGLRLDHVALNARKSSSWQRQLLLEEGRAQEFPRPASCETLLAGQARRGSRQHPDAQLWGGQSARMTSSPGRS